MEQRKEIKYMAIFIACTVGVGLMVYFANELVYAIRDYVCYRRRCKIKVICCKRGRKCDD